MTQCGACRQELGMNRKCAECMRHMLREGSKRMDEAKVREWAGAARAWIAAAGNGAPAELLKSAERLVSFLEKELAGKGPKAGGKVSLAAFAMNYVVSPQDFAPDGVPGVGWTDDQFVAKLALDELKPALGSRGSKQKP